MNDKKHPFQKITEAIAEMFTPAPSAKELADDLRIYLREVITALRWIKDRHLKMTFYAVVMQSALFTGFLRDALLESVGRYGVVIVATSFAIIYILLSVEIWESIQKLRKREKRILDKLSPDLLNIITDTTTTGTYDDVGKMRGWDKTYFFAQASSVIGLAILHWYGVIILWCRCPSGVA